MNITKKNIKNIQKIVHLLRDVENERLYQLLNQISEELTYLTESDATINKEKFEVLRNKTFRLLKRESDFVLPYLDKLLDKELNGEPDTGVNYRNLAMPVKKLIIEHHETFAKYEELKRDSYDFSFMSENNFEHTKILSDLFDLYQLFEKHIYLEENILFPSVVQIFEHGTLVPDEEIKTYSHVAA